MDEMTAARPASILAQVRSLWPCSTLAAGCVVREWRSIMHGFVLF